METQKLIYKNIIAVLKDIGVIGKKTSDLPFQFRSIDDVVNALHPLFQKHGIFIVSEIIEQNTVTRNINEALLLWTTINVKFTFYAEDGSSVTSIMRGEAADDSDKGTSKCMSIALRNALTQMFLIPTGKPGAETPAPKPGGKEEDKRPWMSGALLKKLLERIEAGEKGIYERAEKGVKMKNEYKQKLKAAVKKASDSPPAEKTATKTVEK